MCVSRVSLVFFIVLVAGCPTTIGPADSSALDPGDPHDPNHSLPIDPNTPEDPIDPIDPGTDVTSCDVADVFDARCVTCHSGTRFPDLRRDSIAALVNLPSERFPD